MEVIKFSAQEKSELVQKIKLYFENELAQDIGSFDAEFLLDFFTKEIGHYYYNQALHDADQKLQDHLLHLSDSILSLEK